MAAQGVGLFKLKDTAVRAFANTQLSTDHCFLHLALNSALIGHLSAQIRLECSTSGASFGHTTPSATNASGLPNPSN